LLLLLLHGGVQLWQVMNDDIDDDDIDDDELTH
jgi:hypothetical protein